MEIIVNGERESADFTTVSELLAKRGLDPGLVVVELNGNILPAADFCGTGLAEGDAIEIVQFVAGG